MDGTISRWVMPRVSRRLLDDAPRCASDAALPFVSKADAKSSLEVRAVSYNFLLHDVLILLSERS